MKTMKILTREEEAIVERSRLVVQNKGKRRMIPLIFGISMIFLALQMTLKIVTKLETLGGEELTQGFVAGLALCIVTVLFGFTGALCIGKFLAGMGEEYDVHELLIKLSERLDKSN
jgi:hypothetical protein